MKSRVEGRRGGADRGEAREGEDVEVRRLKGGTRKLVDSWVVQSRLLQRQRARSERERAAGYRAPCAAAATFAGKRAKSARDSVRLLSRSKGTLQRNLSAVSTTASASHANACAARSGRLRLVSHLPRTVARRSSPCQLDRLHVQAQRRGPEPASRREPGRNRNESHCRLELYPSALLTYACAVVSKRTMGKYAFGSDGACSFEACQLRARGYERDWGQLDELVRVSRRSERAGTHLYLRPGGFGGRKPDEAPAGVEYSAARDGAGESAVRAVVLSLSEAVTGGRLCGKGSSQQDERSQRRRRGRGGEGRTPRSRPGR